MSLSHLPCTAKRKKMQSSDIYDAVACGVVSVGTAISGYKLHLTTLGLAETFFPCLRTRVKLGVKESGRSGALFSCDPSIPVTASVHSAVYTGMQIVVLIPMVGRINNNPLQVRFLVYF
jgi:hypothetical protein